MNLLRLSWKNLTYKPLNLGLSLLLFALGTGLVSLLFLLEKQLEDQFEKNLAGVDLVIGAKGSPLQLILSSMYHIDSPTGNISVQEARPFLNPKHPLIAEAIPLSMGDSYRSHRIIGTDASILAFYEAELVEGRLWSRNFEVTLGARAARELGLRIGDTFQSSHGLVQNDDLIHDDVAPFVVVGILNLTGSVIDQLILTDTRSVWAVHDHDHAEHEGHDHAEHEGHDHAEHEGHDHAEHEGHDHAEHEGHDHAEHEGHDHAEHGGHDHAEHGGHDHAEHEGHDHAPPLIRGSILDYPDQEITSLLLRFRNHGYQALNMQRNINENTDLQAATPAIEINRLYDMMGVGTQALRVLALVIILVSALSVFIALFSSLKERRYELALMRVMGASRGTLFFLLLAEGVLLAGLGCLLGLLLSHGGMGLLAAYLEEAYRYPFSGWLFLPKEFQLIFASIAIGILAALLPAFQASRTDISDTLTAS